MRTRTVEYENGETTYRIVVTEATALVGMKRTILQGQAQGYLDGLRKEGADGDGKGKGKGKAADDRPVRSELEVSALGVLAIWTYPALMAAASEMDGLDPAMGMEAFIALPDALVDDWVEATYELNPHWLPQLEPADEEAEKKAQSNDAPVSAPA